MWNDPIMFDLISSKALLGASTPTPKKIDAFETNYGPRVPSKIINKDSIYSPSIEPQEVNFIANTHMLGFKANKSYKSSSDILGGLPNWNWNPTTSLYSGTSWDGNSINFQDSNYSFDNGLPPIDANEWNVPTNFTYQNHRYGVNSISDTFGGPVDFMSGENSYYNTLDPEISGFTLGFGMGSISYDVDGNQIVDGLPSGYVYGDGQTGNSKFIFRNTGTHTIPIHPYNNQISFLTGATSTFNDNKADNSFTTLGFWSPKASLSATVIIF